MCKCMHACVNALLYLLQDRCMHARIRYRRLWHQEECHSMTYLDHVTEDSITIWVNMAPQGSSTSITKLFKLSSATIF